MLKPGAYMEHTYIPSIILPVDSLNKVGELLIVFSLNEICHKEN
jgi:hypothetical protein